MNASKLLPWSLRGIGPFLNSYGDGPFFKSIIKTPPIASNPYAPTGVHSIVPHKNLYAYLVTIKSLLRHSNDFAVFAHDDGSLTDRDIDILNRQIPEVQVLRRSEADRRFDSEMKDPFLSKVRKSYTSYIKLFDPSFISDRQRIILLDTDTLFIDYPSEVIEWAQNGGRPWYHVAPLGPMKNKKKSAAVSSEKEKADVHIQTLAVQHLDSINSTTGQSYTIKQGFCAGFVGYDVGLIDFSHLRVLLNTMHELFGKKVFRWGAEQTVHSLILCGANAEALPKDEYFVFTQNNVEKTKQAKFIHFVGENRFYIFVYPRIAKNIIRQLRNK
ncbi:MAG: hypothetical protein GY941_19950 [Planctomycetes bacterium]|nr:hypothetical protein [Planctomycetota bacterium]